MPYIYLTSFLIAAAGGLFISVFGHALGLSDRPTGRSSHGITVPKGGGIGIVAAILAACIHLNVPLLMWGAVAIVSLLGLCADRTNVSPILRLLLQCLCAALFFLGLGTIPSQDMFSVLFCALAVVYMVGTANIYNFMDGINGIAAMTGIVGFGLLAFFAFHVSGDATIGILSAGIACACLGFLPFNFPNAKIFMGDIGSVTLGFLLSGTVLVLSRTPADFMCFSACAFPFYADEAITMCIRIKNRENLLIPHRTHLYQILANELGYPHWKVTLGYAFIQFLIGISMLIVREYGGVVIATAIFVYFGIFVIFSTKVRQMAKIQRSGT